MRKAASAGGSGHAHPDHKMSPQRDSATSVQRQAAKRKSNAKRRRRDRPADE